MDKVRTYRGKRTAYARPAVIRCLLSLKVTKFLLPPRASGSRLGTPGAGREADAARDLPPAKVPPHPVLPAHTLVTLRVSPDVLGRSG